jgi:hypothetical protein
MNLFILQRKIIIVGCDNHKNSQKHATSKIQSVIILSLVNVLPGNGLVNKFPRRQILGKQSFVRLRKNRGMSVNILTVQHATIDEAVFPISFYATRFQATAR